MGVPVAANRSPAALATAEHLWPPHWWARAVALHERAAAGGTIAASAASEIDLQRWRDGHGGALDRRLGELGLTESGLARLLAEDPQLLCARMPRPAWVDTAEQAVRSAAGAPAPPAQWRDAFALVVAPFAAVALARVDAGGATGDVAAGLTRRLVDLAAPALVSELHRQRKAGLLEGSDGETRFSDFIGSITTSAGLAALLVRFPVLARLLAVTASAAADALSEMLARLHADRPAIVAGLLDGTDPGPLVAVLPDRGDPHDGGRATAVLRFADGRQIVYKPRDPQCQVQWDAMLGWLNQRVSGLDLYRPRTLARAGYGWSEHVPNIPLADGDAAETFYRRLGALLALLHAMHAVDIHCENLVAFGDQPVVVDVETVLHHPSPAELQGTGDPAADVLATSVHRTALLPLMAIGAEGILDMSGIGGDRGADAPVSVAGWLDAGTDRMRPGRTATTYPGAANRPRLGEAEIDELDYEWALIEGFRAAYDAIAAHRAEVSTLVEAYARTRVRFIVRPTFAYRRLIQESLAPHLLADALERDLALGVLWATSTDAYLGQFPRHEIVDLWRGEVPLLYTHPAGLRIGWCDALVAAIPAAVGAPAGPGPAVQPMRPTGLAVALGKIADFHETDRQDQEWIIGATLATRRGTDGHRPAAPLAWPVRGVAAVPDHLVAAACALADQIVARGIPGREQSRVNWLGLELVDERQWLVLPMGAGLAHGYLGVALFLAQLARVSGVARYADVAHRAVQAVPRLFDLLTDRCDLVAAIGGGALYGFGGIAYALSRLGQLLDDPHLADWTRTAVELAAAATAVNVAAGEYAQVDWATGSAGCLAAMLSVGHDTRFSAAAVARQCADHLVAYVHDVGTAPVPVPAGFAAGAAGVCWALTSFVRSAPRGSEPYARAADAAFARVTQAAETVTAGTWCRGTAGLALALAQRGDARAGDLVERLAAAPMRADLSLCHGELGTAEAMLRACTARGLDASAPLRRAGLILDALQWQRRACGTPGGVDSPGFLTGLAGIGYGLLRLARPAEVPSALLLDPPIEFEERRSG